MNPVRILIADDHEVVRFGVRAVIERVDGWVVCGEAHTGSAAVAQAIALRPDVVVLDISMACRDTTSAAHSWAISVASPISPRIAAPRRHCAI